MLTALMRQMDPPVRRAIQGGFLALGAPVGWYLCQVALGAPLDHIPAVWPVYLYLTVSTSLAFVGFGWALGRRERRLERLNEELEQKAITDDLTELKNSGYFWRRAKNDIDHARRSSNPMAMVILDLDHFSRVNDTFGHAIGDRVLAETGEVISDSVRGADVAARVGGEEFAILLEDSGLESALEVAERIRRRVEDRDFISGDVTTINPSRHTTEDDLDVPDVTISAGVAGAAADELGDAEDLFRAADRALYAAKDAGRNCTARADEVSATTPTYGT